MARPIVEHGAERCGAGFAGRRPASYDGSAATWDHRRQAVARETHMGRVKTLVKDGQVARLFGVGQLFHPKLVDIVGLHGGFDGLWVDVEHAGLSMRDVELATLAARVHGLDPIVRLPATDYATIMRPLEAGAGGLIVSMVQGVDHAAQAARWALFGPRGERGVNGGNRDGQYGLEPLDRYVERANAEMFLGIQIETAQAIAEAAEIAALPDVDLLFVGPADLSQVLGVPGQFEHPRCLEAIERIAGICADAGKPWGIVPRGREYAERMARWGCRLFVFGFDIRVVHAGIQAAKAMYQPFFEEK
jgi:2-dehydro-3-deoxyglucarate aldolase/4-hydroxy-2-oxoheptanedioate aldolase